MPATTAALSRPAPPRAIDLHAHFYPLEFLRLASELGPVPGFPIEFSGDRPPAFVLGANRLELDASYWDLGARIRRMDGQGVAMHALSLTTPMVHWAEPELGARLACIVNDAMAQAHAAFPDRFVGCAVLPLQDPGLALAELERAAALPGIRGVYLPTHVRLSARASGAAERSGPTGPAMPARVIELSDPSLFPLYERAQALGLPLLLHPVDVVGAERLRRFYLGNLLGNPFESAIAAAELVFGGVLDRFGTLEIVLPHAGGALPYLSGRLHHGGLVRPETRGATQKPFLDYLRRFHYDTITHSPELLRFLVSYVGADRVVLGSDYCFDMGYPQPREVVTGAGFGDADCARILSENAARLLKL